MFYVRTTKTASGAVAVQVVRYENRKKIIAAHIGSAHTSKDLSLLKKTAAQWIERTMRQRRLFSNDPKHSNNLLPLNKCKYLGIRYTFIYDVLSKLFITFKFHLLHNPLLSDLALMRIVEPASKLRSLELLRDYFGIRHQRRDLYRDLKGFALLKEEVEAKVLAVARKHFNFDFSLVFYDVTTLYFESFEQDEFRKPGFSKDNKANQPQILVGLVVNADGFPVAYEIFSGNKFEGHTLIPVIAAFQRSHKIKQLTVVADAAMLSLNNVRALKENGVRYIVGARTGSLSENLIRKVSQKLNQTDGATVRLATEHGDLICGFSLVRFRKDRHEMEKQIQKAELNLRNPSRIKRMKFVKNASHARYALNTDLIARTKLLLGVKGYYTNMPPEIDNDMIISHYSNLWHVEQAFRIAKSDLRIRPIYHFKERAIQFHVLICFMALAVSKYMEIKTGKSIKTISEALKDITDARILNLLTQKEIILRSEVKDGTKRLLEKLGVWY